MKDFGYKVLKDETIDYDRQDMRIRDYLLIQEPSVNLCIGCGSCTGTCTTGHFTEFNIRKVHTLIRRGEIRELKKEIRKCMFCGKCQLICPRGVNLRNVIISVNKAIELFG